MFQPSLADKALHIILRRIRVHITERDLLRCQNACAAFYNHCPILIIQKLRIPEIHFAVHIDIARLIVRVARRNGCGSCFRGVWRCRRCGRLRLMLLCGCGCRFRHGGCAALYRRDGLLLRQRRSDRPRPGLLLTGLRQCRHRGCSACLSGKHGDIRLR